MFFAIGYGQEESPYAFWSIWISNNNGKRFVALIFDVPIPVLSYFDTFIPYNLWINLKHGREYSSLFLLAVNPCLKQYIFIRAAVYYLHLNVILIELPQTKEGELYFF